MSDLSGAVPTRSLLLKIFECGFCIAMTIVALVGNILVIMAIYRNPILRNTTNMYLISLAVSDLLSAVLAMPLTTGTLINGHWIYGQVACEIYEFFGLYVFYISPVTMGLTAFNRYIRIVKTNSYQKIFSFRRSFVWLGSIWFFIAAYMIVPTIFGVQEYGFYPLYAVCTVIHLDSRMRLGHYVFVTTIFILFPLTIAFYCYYRIFRTIRQHNLNAAPSLQNRSGITRIAVQEIRISRSLFGVVLGFAICWVPSYLVAVIVRFNVVPDLHPSVALICILCIFLSSTINPFIYAGMNRAFRSEFVLPYSRDNRSLEFQNYRSSRTLELSTKNNE